MVEVTPLIQYSATDVSICKGVCSKSHLTKRDQDGIRHRVCSSLSVTWNPAWNVSEMYSFHMFIWENSR